MLTVLMIVLAVLIALLAIPITLRFHLTHQQQFAGEVRLRWAFGLVDVALPKIEGNGDNAQERKEQKKKRKKDRKRESKFSIGRAIKDKPFRQRILRFIKQFWQAIKKRDFKFHLRLGTGDPAETGKLWAFFGPLGAILATSNSADIAIVPDFIDDSFELDSRGEIEIVPLQLIYLVLGLLLSPTVWRTLNRTKKY